MRALFYVEQNYGYAILRPLQREIRHRGGDVRWFLVGNEIDAAYLELSEATLASVHEVRDWQPDVVFVPGNTVPRFIPGLKVEVFHGVPAGKSYGRSDDAHYSIRHCFDLYCTHGPDSTERFKVLARRHGYFEVLETGWPMLDPLYTPVVDNPFADAQDERPTILFCSTFSRRYSCAETLYEEIRKLKADGRFRWLVQFHPKMAFETVEKYRELSDENLRFVETDNVIPLLQAADTMLCDTSSILIMFLLLGKPVVAFRNQDPGPHLINVSEPEALREAIESSLAKDRSRDALIEAYGQRVDPFKDGRASQRILDGVETILKRGLEVRRSKPWNLIRELKMRRQLNYWAI